MGMCFGILVCFFKSTSSFVRPETIWYYTADQYPFCKLFKLLLSSLLVPTILISGTAFKCYMSINVKASWIIIAKFRQGKSSTSLASNTAAQLGIYPRFRLQACISKLAGQEQGQRQFLPYSKKTRDKPRADTSYNMYLYMTITMSR